MTMKPLVCKCCGGKIDRSTMTCLYCDTTYLASEGYFEEDVTDEVEVCGDTGIIEFTVECLDDKYQIIKRLHEILERYGEISVADLYDLIGKTATYWDNKRGWKTLSGMKISGRHFTMSRPINLFDSGITETMTLNEARAAMGLRESQMREALFSSALDALWKGGILNGRL